MANNKNVNVIKAAKINPIYEKLLENWQQFVVLEKLLSTDKNMVPYRGYFPIKQ